MPLRLKSTLPKQSKRLPIWPDGIAHPALKAPVKAGRIAGIDEAGRGPWAGPVVASAVILPGSSLPVRIDDSKRLTPKQREKAFAVILQRACVGFGVVDAASIDRRNILQATLLAMRLAIEDLEQTPSVVLIDGNALPQIALPCVAVVGGDGRSLAIAAASIMAKVLRDRLMRFYHQLQPHYAFHAHKGYGTPLHQERLKEHGPSLFHRRSFRPVAEAFALIDAHALAPTGETQNAAPAVWAAG